MMKKFNIACRTFIFLACLINPTITNAQWGYEADINFYDQNFLQFEIGGGLAIPRADFVSNSGASTSGSASLGFSGYLETIVLGVPIKNFDHSKIHNIGLKTGLRFMSNGFQNEAFEEHLNQEYAKLEAWNTTFEQAQDAWSMVDIYVGLNYLFTSRQRIMFGLSASIGFNIPTKMPSYNIDNGNYVPSQYAHFFEQYRTIDIGGSASYILQTNIAYLLRKNIGIRLYLERFSTKFNINTDVLSLNNSGGILRLDRTLANFKNDINTFNVGLGLFYNIGRFNEKREDFILY